MERKWWKEGVVYQIYPRSFNDSNGDGIGDLPGIIEKLDYLKELGVDIIWLCPVYKSPNDDNGYDISDYYDIMDEFGTMEDMDKLIEGVHKRGMKLIMDLVVNHTSDEHPWFQESKSSKDNPYRDFYIWRKGKNDGPPNNWGSAFSGSAWEYDEKTGEYYLHLFSKKQPDLNWENPRVREEVYKMMRWWLDKGIDGFRMDVINMISKVKGLPDGKVYPGAKYGDGSPYYLNGPRVHDYLQEMNREVLSKYDVMTVGETPGVTPEIARKYVGYDRNELNMVFQFELMGIDCGLSKWDKKDWKLTEFKRIFNRWYEGLKEKGWNSLYMNNHDQPRMVPRFGNDKEYRVESAKLLATLLHTFPGTPYIYQGEEIGMTNVAFDSIEDYRDIETLNWYREQIEEGRTEAEVMEAIHWASRDNARTPMQWDDSPHAGFTTGTPWVKVNPNYKDINVAKARKDQDSIFHYYRRLIQLRKENPVIVYGDYRPILEDDEKLFSYLRTLNEDGEESRLLVILNFSEEEVKFKLPEGIGYSDKKILIGNYPVGLQKDLSNLTLKPYEALVYQLI
ncbi:glycoside hydrolase family 13 protein [Halothermothrix orenii]|uniref:Alpha amylase catalytic region n=1 Tax=Halothermothrix orenii (strain H 168 / OCM 544 / DSM 9562) TaxID=373903 RepID=B8D0R2_HALOH|nr:alpha-glucosidase [Halothermothrix orenii]ACL70998.1 alpha amylase catalytic region [Halothermothrix orenii H 168]